MTPDYPFPIPEAIQKTLDTGIRRSVTHPDFCPSPNRPYEPQVFSSLEQISMALSCLVKTYHTFRFTGEFFLALGCGALYRVRHLEHLQRAIFVLTEAVSLIYRDLAIAL